jgi:hypothetical protein
MNQDPNHALARLSVNGENKKLVLQITGMLLAISLAALNKHL